MIRIKELRLEKKLNMRQAAIALNIPYTTYISYEKGDREPNSEMLITLADYFNCSIDYLLGRSDERISEDVLDKVNTLDDNLLSLHENIYEATKAQKERAQKLTASQLINNEHLFDLLSNDEISHIKKYRTLDEHGQKVVDYILNEEYDRCTAEPEEETPTVSIHHSTYKVSAGRGFDLEDRDSWEEIEIPDTPIARKADFAVTIKGDSMEPIYSDGQIVLVREQPAVDIGETGIYIVNGGGFIKINGGDRLISINPKYDDISFNESDSVYCAGKVIGVV